jgi:hypothetical protein
MGVGWSRGRSRRGFAGASAFWKTAKAYAGSCRRFELNLNDGSSHTFVVRFR